MFQSRVHRSTFSSLISATSVTYHTIVRQARGGHSNAVIALVLNMLQAVILIGAFLLLYGIMGVRGSPIRGDMLLFLMTGIFVYLSHIKAVGAVMGAVNPTSAMNLHRPMNSLIAILSAAISTLYMQLLTLIIVLSLYHMVFQPITILDPIGALGVFMLGWLSGCAVGMILGSLSPWFPRITTLLRLFYIRINMIASGKMFLANALPASMISVFEWNPLFHIIDQLRGETFLHYNPQFTTLSYPVFVSLALIMIGLMGEFFARTNISVSRFAGR